MVELREITKDNLEDVLNLNVSEHQKAFVSSVSHSLAQAYVYKETAFPFAIYVNDIPVGFIMLGYYEERKQYTLWKLLIDIKYQSKGYGKMALRLAINFLADNYNAKEVYTGVSLGNEAAMHLYTSFGFEKTGLVENNAYELRYIIN